jgi:YVTN family beta-propeller protein
MLYITMMNHSTEAQISQNKLESIANQTNVSTTPQVNVGNSPYSVSYLGNSSEIEDSVYVANYLSDTVSVINPANGTVIKNIPVGHGPYSIAIPTSPFGLRSGDSIYVVNTRNNSVSVINPFSNIVKQNITVGFRPTDIAVTSSRIFGDEVYVVSADGLSQINLFSENVTDNIDVGAEPSSIAISPSGDSVYVAGMEGLWVVDTSSNNVTDNIIIADEPFLFVPSSIAISPSGDSVYVANQVNNTVSVIDNNTLSVTDNIRIGDRPISIAISPSGDSVYVANANNNSVSVIDTLSNNVTDNIRVGDRPVSIAISPSGDSVYVANSDSDTISIIDPVSNRVMAGVTLDSIPFRGGQISCNGLNAPGNRYFYVSSGTKCVAKPNSGYEFASWVEIFDDNSTRTINASTISGSPWTSFLNIFGIELQDPTATFTVTKYGKFTAYFKALPPPVPAEFTFSLITIVVTALVGSLLIPAAVGWSRSKKQTSRLNSFHLKMVSINKDGLDEKDIGDLNDLNQSISNSYAAGKITNEQYTSLKDEVSSEYQKIYKKRIESLTDPNTEAVSNIKNEIEDAYSDRKITELDYNLLNSRILRMSDNK